MKDNMRTPHLRVGNEKKAREYGYLLLRYRPRSIKEFQDRLVKKGFSEDITARITAEFKESQLLDDKKFASAWVAERTSLKPAGKSLIRRELAHKGVEAELIGEVLGDIRPFYDEEKEAKTLAEKKLRTLGRLDKLKKKRRIYAFLARRGFSGDAIWKAIEELF